MEVGLLIRNRRQALDMDLRGLEKKSGINHGTISRLENGKVHIFMETAIQLLNVLKMDPVEIIDPERKRNIKIASSIHPSKEYLNTADLLNLLNVFQNRPFSTLDNLIDLTEELSSGNKNCVLVLKEYRNIRSSHKESSLLPELTNTLMEQEYPIDFENTNIIKINNLGGAVSLLDFGHFLKNIRKVRSLSLLEVQERSGISDSTLSNLENANNVKVKLSEILTLEKILKSNGDLFRLIWNAFEFKPRYEDNSLSSRWSTEERSVINYIFSFYRWLQTNEKSIASKWLYKLRTIF
jgi:transcriptional regulator with XRE-family HTH domain